MGFQGRNFTIFDGCGRELDGFGGELDGGVDAVEVDEVPDVLAEGLWAPIDIVANGLAAGEVVGIKFVANKAVADRLFGGDGLGEEPAAKGKDGDVADAGSAFWEEGDREAVSEAFGHALCGLSG